MDWQLCLRQYWQLLQSFPLTLVIRSCQAYLVYKARIVFQGQTLMTGVYVHLLIHSKTHVYFWFQMFEQEVRLLRLLHPFCNISVILWLGSRRCPISEIQLVRPRFESGFLKSGYIVSIAVIPFKAESFTIHEYLHSMLFLLVNFKETGIQGITWHQNTKRHHQYSVPDLYISYGIPSFVNAPSQAIDFMSCSLCIEIKCKIGPDNFTQCPYSNNNSWIIVHAYVIQMSSLFYAYSAFLLIW